MRTSDIQSWLNGDKLRSETLRKHYKLIGLIVVLVFVYIFAGYRSMQQQNRLSDLRKEVKDKKMEYLTISAELVQMTRKSHISVMLEEEGSTLQESVLPPIKIE